MADFTVQVGNVGTVYSGKSELDARKAFKDYVKASLLQQGRAAGEDVTLLKDDEIIKEHLVPQVLKNPQFIDELKPHARRVAAGARKAKPHIVRAGKAVKSQLLSLHSKLKKNPVSNEAEIERLKSLLLDKSVSGMERKFIAMRIDELSKGKKPRSVKRNPLREGPDKAGGMAAFEHDVVSNPYDASEDLAELLVEGYDDNGYYLINYFGVPEDIVRKLEYLAENSSGHQEAALELSSFISDNYTEKQADEIAERYRKIIKEHRAAKKAARAAKKEQQSKTRQPEEYDGDFMEYMDLLENPSATRKLTKEEREEIRKKIREKMARIIREAEEAEMTPLDYYFADQERAPAKVNRNPRAERTESERARILERMKAAKAKRPTASQVAARKQPKRKPTKKELEERKKATRLISEAKKAGMTPSAYYFQKQARAEARKAAAEARKAAPKNKQALTESQKAAKRERIKYKLQEFRRAEAARKEAGLPPLSAKRALTASQRAARAVQKNPRMTIADFIKQYKPEIDAYIKKTHGSNIRLNDKERRMFIENDEGLYGFARSCGVRI